MIYYDITSDTDYYLEQQAILEATYQEYISNGGELTFDEWLHSDTAGVSDPTPY